MLIRISLCFLLITNSLIAMAHSQKTPDVTTRPVLTDPLNRTTEELLKEAHKSRSSNRQVESVTLAYLALKAAEREKHLAGSYKARAHLFLSEAMDAIGYRAMERIHAKAAFRERERDEHASSTLEVAPFLTRLGAVAMHGWDPSLAEYYFNLTLATYEAAQPPNSVGMASTLIQLANLAIQQGHIRHILDGNGISKLQIAQEYLDRAHSLINYTIPDPDKLKISHAILELQAELLLRLSSHIPADQEEIRRNTLTQAEKLFQTSLDRLKSDPDSLLRDQFPLMNGLMAVKRRTKHYVEAMDIAQEILQLAEKLQRVDPEVTLNMALVSGHFPNNDLVVKLCGMVMTQEEARLREVSSMSSEALSLAFSSQGRYQSMQCLSLLSQTMADTDNGARQMLEIVLRRKATVTDAEETFWKTLHSHSATDLQAARTKLISLRSLLSTKVVKDDGTDLWRIISFIGNQEEVLSVEPWWRAFQSASSHTDEREIVSGYGQAIIEGKSPWEAIAAQKGGLDVKKVTVASVAENLNSDAALVEFVKVNDFDLEREIFSGSARYWALILFPNGQTKAIDLGLAKQLEAKITASLKTLHSDDRLFAPPQLQAMSALYEAIWAPFAPLLDKTENIILSPDASLALVPFGALLAPDGLFIIEHHTLYQIATGRQFIEPKQKQGRTSNSSVVIADPDYDFSKVGGTPKVPPLKMGRPAGIHSPLVQLQATLKEGNLVKEILGEQVELFTREKASESTVRQVRSPRVLHLATHGLFLKPQESPKGENLSKEDTVALNSAYARHVRALSRSGLALAGINPGGLANDEDGLLTAFDVTGMDLSGTDLVVLSGCDTGLGDASAGEGVLGLSRSFRIAGARYVVMSLWAISDKEAVRQMRTFYKAYATGTNPVLALRDMQRARISSLRKVLDTPPPALWAALTVQGL